MSSSSSRHPSLTHAPATPSGLRESHTIAGSPEDRFTPITEDAAGPSSSETSPNSRPTHIHIDREPSGWEIDQEPQSIGGKIANETTALLRKPFEFVTGSPHDGPCDHGTFSPGLDTRPGSVRSGNSGYGFGGARSGSGGNSPRGIFGSLMENMGVKNGGLNGKKKQSTTSYLAEQHGIKNTRTMYVSDLLPGNKLMVGSGICPIIYPSLHGYDNTNGLICKEISLRL